VGKGLENLRKAYGELGYINFTPVPETRFDDDKKLIYLDIDVDEGKQFYVRRIEFIGNTTTRDKVIRREIALEEGSVYNSRLWELSLLRLNQLGYFDVMKPEDPNVTVRQLDEKNGLVDLTLKVKEKHSGAAASHLARCLLQRAHGQGQQRAQSNLRRFLCDVHCVCAVPLRREYPNLDRGTARDLGAPA
jgi:outer membrane protein assembly factor BamA